MFDVRFGCTGKSYDFDSIKIETITWNLSTDNSGLWEMPDGSVQTHFEPVRSYRVSFVAIRRLFFLKLTTIARIFCHSLMKRYPWLFIALVLSVRQRTYYVESRHLVYMFESPCGTPRRLRRRWQETNDAWNAFTSCSVWTNNITKCYTYCMCWSPLVSTKNNCQSYRFPVWSNCD